MIIYIKEVDNEKLNLIEKVKLKLNRPIFRNIDDNRKVIMLLNKNDEKYETKILNIVNRKLQKYKDCKVVMSKKLTRLQDKIQAKIIKGKLVEKALLDKILQLITKKLRAQDLYILSKTYDLEVIKMIEYFAEKVKTINIITNEIEKYKRLEDKIYTEKGILITVANNKKKSLKRANIIINMDFNNDEINSYNVNRRAIIVNLIDSKIDKITGFEGIIVNNVQVELDGEIRKFFENHKLYGYFENSALYEAVNSVIPINDRNLKLKELIGNNGIIRYDEIKSIVE